MTTDIRILVVDDSQPVREFIVQALASQEGFTTLEASDGVQGLEMALADAPDLILLDLEMPRFNGFQVLDALRVQQADIPVILITSHGSEAITVEHFRKGVKDCLIKPFTAEQMQTAIERALAEACLHREKEALTQRLAAANEQLRGVVRELDTLYRVGKSATALLSRKQLLERILDAAFYVTEAEEAGLMLVDAESGEVRTEIYRQRVPGGTHQPARRSAEELAAEAVRSGEVAGSETMLCAPLKSGERATGVLAVANCMSGQPFSGRARQLLIGLADCAAIAFENAHLREKVRQADQTRSEFISFVTHELRTPMTSIRGYADLLAQGSIGPLEPQQKEFIGTIIRNVERMQVLISDLRDMTRIETGQVNLEVRLLRVTEALESALRATRPQIEARSQQLAVEAAENTPLVRADPARLVQILTNLLSNANKYTPKGGQIRVRVWREENDVHCAVSDTGIGIGPEDQARLFTKFFRSEDPAVREMTGTGLGLCIVKSLVELQGGRIAVESARGEGTTVRFTVPVVEEEGETRRQGDKEQGAG